VDVALIGRCVAGLVDGRDEVVEGADGIELALLLTSNGPACGGDDEGSPDDPQRDASIVEGSGELSVAAAGTQWRARQADIVGDDGVDVGLPGGDHGFFLFLRAAASF
jgi:hypothetical protein